MIKIDKVSGNRGSRDIKLITFVDLELRSKEQSSRYKVTPFNDKRKCSRIDNDVL